MPEIRTATLSQQITFLKTAAEQGVDAAVERDGELISAGEALALKKLSATEMTELVKLNEKVAGLRGGSLAASDWVCVNVVC